MSPWRRRHVATDGYANVNLDTESREWYSQVRRTRR